ncbi:hypothetical protein Z043_125950 [Scleropages formosus]|uniref:Cation efflux protein transmembrane domain-containing protein n=1 Tax=Scleropages formosus TaxID=113540 RepID=A0A0P7UCM1_SCLFO|nr:hypothetical protein Z043_125950 [Scleropages formosus]
MSGAHLMSRVRSVFRKERADCGLSDASTFDWSSELEDEEVPRFSELRVVVSDGPQSNGAPGATDEEEEDDDDDSLLGSSSGLGPVAPARSCEGCRKRRERTSRGRVMKRLGCASLLYFLFMVGELTGGYVANSLAIMTDALHMLTDLIGIIVSLLALWLSARSPSKRFTFGLHRLVVLGPFLRAVLVLFSLAEVVSAGISVLLIYILTGVLLNEAVQRTIHQDFDIDGDVMLITAAVGVAVNLV